MLASDARRRSSPPTLAVVKTQQKTVDPQQLFLTFPAFMVASPWRRPQNPFLLAGAADPRFSINDYTASLTAKAGGSKKLGWFQQNKNTLVAKIRWFQHKPHTVVANLDASSSKTQSRWWQSKWLVPAKYKDYGSKKILWFQKKCDSGSKNGC